MKYKTFTKSKRITDVEKKVKKIYKKIIPLIVLQANLPAISKNTF